jgi:hypothetical protein
MVRVDLLETAVDCGEFTFKRRAGLLRHAGMRVSLKVTLASSQVLEALIEAK